LARLGVFSGRDLVRLLGQHGFREVRRRGSHVIVQRVEAGRTITVPIPDHAEIRRGTLQSIIRQSRLPRSVFEGE
jgi:predicted RNA binding protein YcfA (HicA-like mRNA interferase family)